MAKKGNSKSIRLSDEVLAYIESYEGKGFNEKFENIILFAMKTEGERKKRVEYLDRQIAEKQHEIQMLVTRHNNFTDQLRQMVQGYMYSDLNKRLY